MSQQPPPGPPSEAYGQPSSGRRTSKGLAVAVVLGALLVVGGGVTAAILLREGDDVPVGRSSEQGPAETVESYTKALFNEAECERIIGYLSQEHQDANEVDCSTYEPMAFDAVPLLEELEVSARVLDESGDTATVELTLHPGTRGNVYEMVKHDGVWYIDGIRRPEPD